MATVLTIGGARFMGRYAVRAFLDRGDDVTLFTRGKTPIPFDSDDVDHVQGDRRNEDDLRAAAEGVDPDVVVDFAAFYPADVRTATEVFADVDAYVFVSSTSAYDRSASYCAREGASPLYEYPGDRGTDEDETRDGGPGDAEPSYGERKAEGDRVVFAAADRGIDAISVRPTAIYGPYDPTERQNYWIERIDRFDRIVVPGEDDRTPIPLGYVEDVARAITLVVERGEPGEAYNVASRSTPTIDDFVGHVADALGTSVTVAHASRGDLASVGLDPGDFAFCRATPYVVSTEKLASLGWESTPFEMGVERAVADHLDRRPDWSGPSRETEERLLAALGDPRSLGET